MSRYELNSKYILKTDNANLVVSLVDMKLYLRVDTTADDALITEFIKSATLLVEKYTGRELLNKTFTMYADFFPYPRQYGRRLEENFNQNTIQVKRSKLQSIESIKYYIDSVLTELDDSRYSFSKDNIYSRIYLVDESDTYPNIDNRKQAVEVEFVAGYGLTEASVPSAFKTAIKIIVTYMYENRGDCGGEFLMPNAASAILDIYKIKEI